VDRKIKFCMLAVVAVLFAAAAVVQGAAAPKPPAQRKPVIYIVVEVKSIQGVVTYDVIPVKSLAERRKQCQTDYVRATDDWKRAKADAQKKKEKFDQQKPVEPYVKRVGSQTFKTEELARDVANKLQEKLDEARKRAEENKKKETEKPPASTGSGEKPATDTGTGETPAGDAGTKEEGK